MKIQVKASELGKKMSRVLGVVAAKVTIPVLSYVKVDVKAANQAVISGSDLGMSMIQTVPIELKSTEAGSILLPAKKVSEILNNLPSDSILTIETEGENLRLKAGKLLNTKLAGQNAALFPAIETRPATQFNINSAALKKVVARVESAAPAKAGRQSVPSIVLESSAAGLRAIATDGFRIAVADAPGAGAGDFSIQIPKTFLGLIKDLPGEVTAFSQSETNMFFASGDEVLLIRIPVTKFPGVQKILAISNFVTEVAVPVPALKSAISIASVTSASKNPSVAMVVADELIISSDSVEGTTESAVESKVSGAANKVNVHQAFVLDFLSQSEGSVIIRFIDEKSLVKFTNGTDYQYFVMPLLPDAPKEEKPAKA